jgi:hypothetical protein
LIRFRDADDDPGLSLRGRADRWNLSRSSWWSRISEQISPECALPETTRAFASGVVTRRHRVTTISAKIAASAEANDCRFVMARPDQAINRGDTCATPKINRVRSVPLPNRHGPTRPDKLYQRSAATGGPDKPGHDEAGCVGRFDYCWVSPYGPLEQDGSRLPLQRGKGRGRPFGADMIECRPINPAPANRMAPPAARHLPGSRSNHLGAFRGTPFTGAPVTGATAPSPSGGSPAEASARPSWSGPSRHGSVPARAHRCPGAPSRGRGSAT